MKFFTLHIPSVDSDTAAVPMSPTKDGKMRKDKHWIIKFQRNAAFDHPYKPHCLVYPVTSSEVNFQMWTDARKNAAVLEACGWGEQWVGRRVNDEVELFFEEAEEYELLKQNLEESGFSVRAYVQQTESKKFPKVDKKSLEGGGKNTLMSRIMKSIEHRVNETEFEKGLKIQYGFIADVPGPKKALCIANVDEEMFENKKGEKGASIPGLYTTLEGKREQWKIVGEIRNGEAKFWCTEEETKSYFDSLGLIGNTAWQDLAEEKREKEREERRKEKRAAKKQRRMMTESTTATTPSEMSFGFRLTEDEEEVVKARQRAKQNEKRKKQKQRRREEAMEANNTTSKNGSDSDDIKSDDSGKKKWSTIAKQGNRAVQQNKKGEYKVVTFTDLPEDSGVGSNGEDSAEEERRPKVKLPKMQHKRPDKEVRVDEEGLETVMVQSVEEARQYMHRPMLVAWPQEDGSDKRTLFTDLSYIGRGL